MATSEAVMLNVGLACNNEHGTEDRLTMVELPDEMLTLEGDTLDGDEIEFVRGRLYWGNRDSATWFRYESRARHVGNICWDQVVMSAAETARFVNHLRTLPHWSVMAGWSELFKKGRSVAPFTAEDFMEPTP